jgi:hypothetical protein
MAEVERNPSVPKFVTQGTDDDIPGGRGPSFAFSAKGKFEPRATSAHNTFATCAQKDWPPRDSYR